MFGVERAVRLTPNGERGPGADRAVGGGIGRREVVRAHGKALGPADRAEAVSGAGKRRSVGGKPGVGNDRVVLEAVELERAQDIEAELSQYRFEAAIRFGFRDPLKPR